MTCSTHTGYTAEASAENGPAKTIRHSSVPEIMVRRLRSDYLQKLKVMDALKTYTWW